MPLNCSLLNGHLQELCWWLRLCTPNAEGMGLIPGQGTKIPQVAQHGQKKMVNYMLYGFYFHIKKNPGAHGTTVPERIFCRNGPWPEIQRASNRQWMPICVSPVTCPLWAAHSCGDSVCVCMSVCVVSQSSSYDSRLQEFSQITLNPC